ncbi:DNA-binding protein [Nitrincola nitratireducens]|uniref:Chromosome segregation protein SMC n=1 Tax=Nitrincola nitratireducens TaxID=1229521 RepID=W9UPA3_9GAMM|nr:DNA-binding protein [Nitrincola nitratireducens]EXJ09038.1 chromosome segregation protein SMC [Nitrincola nitratireducens]
MARTGITYLEVTTAIDKIIAAGDEPTIQKIRDVLGTGSPNTIHRFLTQWRSARPVEQRKAVELPADLAAALLKEIERQAADARAEVEKQLVAAQAEAAELSRDGEVTEADLETAREALDLKDAENSKLKADFDRVTDSLARAMHELEAERKITNEQRDELALNRNRVITLTEQVNDLKAELAASKQEAKAAHDAAVAAEKMAAVAAAQLEAEQSKNADLVSRLTNADAELAKLRDKYDSKVSECAKVKEDLAYTQKEINELHHEISEHVTNFENAKREADALKEHLALEHRKNAELQSEIDSLTDKLTAQSKTKK